MIRFNCKNCGSSKLAYQKFVKNIITVEITEDGTVFYNDSSTDEKDGIATSNGFCCATCGKLIEHCGVRFETESQLLTYLTMDEDIQQQQEKDYQDYIDAEISAQEQRERERACYDQEVADMTVEMEL